MVLIGGFDAHWSASLSNLEKYQLVNISELLAVWPGLTLIKKHVFVLRLLRQAVVIF